MTPKELKEHLLTWNLDAHNFYAVGKQSRKSTVAMLVRLGDDMRAIPLDNPLLCAVAAIATCLEDPRNCYEGMFFNEHLEYQPDSVHPEGQFLWSYPTDTYSGNSVDADQYLQNLGAELLKQMTAY
jgi:hypothetical protein